VIVFSSMFGARVSFPMSVWRHHAAFHAQIWCHRAQLLVCARLRRGAPLQHAPRQSGDHRMVPYLYRDHT
jgi:hypothetical protein